MTHNWIAILDFGSQYSQLIARRIREQHVYSELIRFDTPAKELAKRKPSGIILSGGPSSVFEENAPIADAELYELGIPILGVCYGMQLTSQLLGGTVKPGKEREYGHADIDVVDHSSIFEGLPARLKVWMSHGDQVDKLPAGFDVIAKTDTCPNAAMANLEKKVFGLQFHPEVVHTPKGTEILRRFIFDICDCKPDWEMAAFIKESVDSTRRLVGSV